MKPVFGIQSSVIGGGKADSEGLNAILSKVRAVIMLLKQGMALLCLLFLMPVAGAGTKEELQRLQTDIVQLQTKILDLQKSQEAQTRALRDLLIQVKDDVGNTSTSVSDLKKRLQGQEKELGTSFTELLRQLRGIGERLDSADQRLSVLATQVSSLKLKTEEASREQPGSERAPAADELFNNSYKSYLSGEHELALDGFKKFLRYYPKSERAAEAQYYIGESYYGMKRYSDAIKAFEELAGTFPTANVNAPALYKSGLVFMEMEVGNRPEAINRFQSVIAKYPNSDEAKLAKKRLELLGAPLKPSPPTRSRPVSGAKRPEQ